MSHGLFFLLTIVWTVPASAQASSPTVGSAMFAEDPQHTIGAWGDVTTRSDDGRNLTTTMPPPAAINSNLTVGVEITYEPKVASWYPPVLYTPLSYADGDIQMTYQSNSVNNGVRMVTLTAKTDKLKALDEPRKYRFRFDPGPSAEMIWEILPYEGPNYVANIAVDPGSPPPGDLVRLEISLSEPVTAAEGQHVAWRVVPANGFVEVREGSDYNSSGLSWVTIPQGQQRARIVARLSSTMHPGSRVRIETWPKRELNTMAEPAYQYHTFRIGQPPRN